MKSRKGNVCLTDDAKHTHTEICNALISAVIRFVGDNAAGHLLTRLIHPKQTHSTATGYSICGYNSDLIALSPGYI